MARVRYKRRLLKFALPSVAMVLMGAVALWPTMAGLVSKIHPPFVQTLAVQAHRAALRPLYRTTDKAGQTVLIAAEKAVEAGQQRYQLQSPKLEYQLESGQHVLITAEKGFYRVTQKTLEAEGEVHVIHSLGYDFVTPHATIDIASGHIKGTQSVEGSGPTGSLTGQGFEVTEKGNRLVVHQMRMRG